MKSIVTATLSVQSLEKAQKSIDRYFEAYKKGVTNGILFATQAMYQKVLEYCYANGIESHTANIKYEYDEKTKTGRVYTNDMVIIFNEMGTGVTGMNSPHPAPSDAFQSWVYDKNGHGEDGWWYPTNENDPNPTKKQSSDGTMIAWTKGLPSRHMFFDAFEDIKDEIGGLIEVEIRKSIGDLY